MRNIISVLLLISCFALGAQHTISGTFSPAKDFTWVIAYGIGPGTRAYVADTAIDNGKFTLSLPATAKPGTYRLVYAVPQEEFYFDLLYNGNEDIELAFDIQKGVTFSSSGENKIFRTYLKEITGVKQKFINYYSAGKTDMGEFQKLTGELNGIQTRYEQDTNGMLANEFIRANRPYIPSEYESSKSYWQNKKAHFFDHIDLKNPVLQASGFLTDRLNAYVFTAITAAKKTKAEKERTYQGNIRTVHEKLVGTDSQYQVHVFHKLWNRAASYGFNSTSDFIFDTYLGPLAKSNGRQKIIADVEAHNRLRFGATAPDIIWKDGVGDKRLSEMEGDDCYVLIFWSSTCSHCLTEIPSLHKRLRAYPGIKVIAVGLEDNDLHWKRESAKLPDFEHALALGKWENQYAKQYAIAGTPTYFILDKDKRIIAKPGNDREVVAFLQQN